MMKAFESFLTLPEQDKRDVFEAAASRLDTLPSYVEKDFWVCFVLDVFYNRLPVGHPRLLFKGGTSLSKAFGLIRRFSEDIDLVVFRDDLGFKGDRDPTAAGHLSNKRRNALFKGLFRVFSGCPVDPCAIMQFLWDRYRPLRSSLAADRAPASHKSLITFMLA